MEDELKDVYDASKEIPDEHPHDHHNADFFSSGDPIVLQPSVTEPTEPIIFEDVDMDEDRDLPQSSFDNIIPMQNIRHGFQVRRNSLNL